MEDIKFTKLSALVGDQFTVESVGEYTYKMWNPATSKMEVSESPQKGFRKIYPVITDKGKLDLSAGQLGQILEGCSYAGKADLKNATFKLGSNGKTGIDIRYWFNFVESQNDQVDTHFDPSQIPPDW